MVQLAPRLLLGCDLLLANEPHRLVEIEFYFHEPGVHEDPFTHRDPIQLTTGQWYLHRTGKGLKGGTYKGIDLTFGGRAHGGILIRALECPDGRIVEGPSLCVDHILEVCGYTTVSELDRVVSGREAWGDIPLRLRWCDVLHDEPLVASGRVGLTLKRAAEHPKMPEMIFQPYRFLRRPRDLRKGRNYLILELSRTGKDVDEIAATTGSPTRSIQRQIDVYTQARGDAHDPTLSAFHDQALKPKVLAQMYGAWSKHFGE